MFTPKNRDTDPPQSRIERQRELDEWNRQKRYDDSSDRAYENWRNGKGYYDPLPDEPFSY